MPIQLIEAVDASDEYCEESRLVDLFGYLLRKLDRITDMLGGIHDSADLRSNINNLEEKCKELAQKYHDMYLNGKAAVNDNPTNAQLLKFRNLLAAFEQILRKRNEKEMEKSTNGQMLDSRKEQCNNIVDNMNNDKNLTKETSPEEDTNPFIVQQNPTSNSITNPFISTAPDTNPYSSKSVDIKPIEHYTKASLATLAKDPIQKYVMEQRERDIQQIHHSVEMINEIFSDLGIIVLQQQDLVDCVELNVENATGRIHQANQEITLTTQTTQNRRFRCCGLPMRSFIFVVVLMVIVVFLLLKV